MVAAGITATRNGASDHIDLVLAAQDDPDATADLCAAGRCDRQPLPHGAARLRLLHAPPAPHR
ncbi:hypothetical protein, partial [Streptomyces bohaiensis]|uniref:hypothetical protein n=1 Tax=Streptomyces bohaiensis TaxID=1431344 RepID=UPI0030C75E04